MKKDIAMTTEQEAKAYEMALEAARKELGVDRKEWEVVEHVLRNIFPELCESEDERIRKVIYQLMLGMREEIFTSQDEIVTKEKVLAYLEKQKELDKMIVVSPEVWDDAISDAFENGKKEGEKQKEHKPEHFELKAGKWYICHRAFCCRADHLTVKEGERFMCEKDGVVKGFIIKEPEKYFIECSAPAPMEDEQKEPHYTKRNALFDKCVENCDPEVMKEVSDKVDEMLGKEQKPDDDPLDDPKFLKGFDTGREVQRIFDEKKPVVTHWETYHVDTLGTQQVIAGKMPQKPAEWSEEDEMMLSSIIETLKYTNGAANMKIDWLKSLRLRQNPIVAVDAEQLLKILPKRQEWSKEEEMYLSQAIETLEHENYLILADKLRSLRPSWKPSEEKKKETIDGVDIGYGLETAIDILENGFTHYQTDDGEYERKQALDVLIFLLNETRKKEDAKLWSKDIVESIVTWATEKLQLYSMKESTPYVEAVKNNAQKVLDWTKEQWPIYYGWRPSEEQMDALESAQLMYAHGFERRDIAGVLESLYNDLKGLM